MGDPAGVWLIILTVAVAAVSGLVSVLGLGFGANVTGWKAGIGTGVTYLARNLFRRGVRS